MKFKKNLFQTIKDPCLMLTYYLAGFIFIKTNYKMNYKMNYLKKHLLLNRCSKNK